MKKPKSEIENARKIFEEIKTAMSGIIIGQEKAVDSVILTLFCNAHSMIVGVPGLAKTLIIKTLSQIIEADFNRIQFTPDLMPSDITGTILLSSIEEGRQYKFIKGPVFTNLLLADEINRTPPKTQSALLQAMEERFVTAEGESHELPRLFNVFATRNPIEQEGTYPLPEAQLDRFMFQIEIDYPNAEDERLIIEKKHINETFEGVKKVASVMDIISAQDIIDDVPAASNIIDFAMNLTRNSRPETTKSALVKEFVRWGASPRAGIYLLKAAKAHALLSGRLAVDMEDVAKHVYLIMKHRIILSFKGEMENINKDEIIEEIIKTSY